ncbi:MAG: type II toxin-antitoxin system VapC family toxin [Rhizobiales bacterium]|nr:type II toxin-antitoxin system VapC family toxin [Hyphomicrobiales bacterium]
MRAVDTNLIVRIFAEDDSEQADIAQSTLAADSVFLPKTVMLEFEWVMRSVYRKPTAAIAAAIDRMLETANVQVEDQPSVMRAVAWFRQGMDFADALHLASSGHVDSFVTFDVDLRRLAARLSVKPPVVAP